MFKIVTTNRMDSRGFFIHAQPLFQFGAHTWKRWTHKLPSFLLQLSIGPGAGYQSRRSLFGIHLRGFTIYLGFRVKGGSPKYLYAYKPGFRLGITCRGNSTPYHFA